MTTGRGLPVEQIREELEGTCRVCFQPECPESTGGRRGSPGAIPTRLADGERDYRGYGEWAVHPNEAIFLLHRGYAIVDGQRQRVRFIANEAYVTQVKVEGTFTGARPASEFIDSALTAA